MKFDVDELVDRAADGDEYAFAKLCREYEPLVRSMSVKYAQMADGLDTEQIAEDFSQEAILALYRATQTYKTRNGNVSFGLYAKVCIRNALVSELRRMSRKVRAERIRERELEQEDFGGNRVPWASAKKADLNSIADGILSPFEKKIFDMYVGEMKIRDISSSLGIPSKSVSNAVYRIKSKIRSSYDREDQD